MEFKKNLKYTIIGVIALLIIAMVTAGDTVITNTGMTSDTLDTGQGANELYDMDQNVLTSSAPTFTTLNTGNGAYELYAMNQDVETGDVPTFGGLYLDGDVGIGTNNPSAKLEVQNDGTEPAIDVESNSYSSLTTSAFIQSNSKTLEIDQISVLDSGTAPYFDADRPTLNVNRISSSRGASIKIGNSNGGFYLYGDNNNFDLLNNAGSDIISTGQTGEINIGSVSSDGTGSVVCIKSDGNLGTCTDQPDASGDCTCT